MSVQPNELESHLISFLSEDCAKMPVEHESEREKGFFICAGSMFAILENNKLTSMSGRDFMTALDIAVRLQSKPTGSSH